MRKSHKNSNQSNFTLDEKWGAYWEFELNRWIEPFFKHQFYPREFSFSSLRSSDIYTDKKQWWKYDTLYHVYDNDNTPKRNVTFEIKADRFRNTGNICIEKQFKKKPSGVFHTEANWFIYYMPRYTENNLYLFKPERLIDFLCNYEQSIRPSGDNQLCDSYIINKELFDADVRNNPKVGRIFSYDLPIPIEFGVEKFEAVKVPTIYIGEDIISKDSKKYNDDLL